MGVGGRPDHKAGSTKQAHGAEGDVGMLNVPDKQTLPSVNELKASLPADCFQPNAFVSLAYVVRAAVFVAGLACAYYAAIGFVNETFPGDSTTHTVARAAIAAVYWFLQGTVFWGIFTIGHDCGHSSFSNSPLLNWVVGNTVHTFILTPYESWRISHRHHHQNTGHMDNDEIFFPMRKSNQWRHVQKFTWSLGFAWFSYLVTGFSPRNVYHFYPNDPLFQYHKSVARVSLSIATYVAWCVALYQACAAYTFSVVADFYFLPLLVFGSWLVITTFLHHNEPGIPWYGSSEWSFVRGALSSVDRDYGVFNSVIHNIGTHQIHHLFPRIPHYKLVRATEAFRQKYPHLVNKSETSIFSAFYSNLLTYVRYGVVDDDAEVFGYTGIHSQPVVSVAGSSGTKKTK